MYQYENAMQLARKLVGQNELQMAEIEALDVFMRHGGARDSDGAPVLSERDHTCSAIGRPCDLQKLAHATLLSLSVYRTNVELITSEVLKQLARSMTISDSSELDMRLQHERWRPA